MFDRCVRVFSLVAMLAAGPMAVAQSASELLEKGIYTEETAGDLDAAIGIYEQILMNAEANRFFAAQAQYRLGVCYAKKGLKGDASAAFQKVIDLYPNYKEVAGLARARLKNLGFGSNGETLAMSTRLVWPKSVFSMGGSSPDGRYISYVNWDKGNLAVHDNETGENRDLTDEGTWERPSQFSDACAWSPDSSQIAYLWHSSGGKEGKEEDDWSELRIVDLDGSKPRALSPRHSTVWPRAWSHDGQYILGLSFLHDDRQIAMISVHDASIRVLKSLGGRTPKFPKLSISPDDRYLAFEILEKEGSELQNIALLPIDGSAEATIIELEHPADDGAPLWSPDGKHIVFTSDRSGADALWMLEIDQGKPIGMPTLVMEMDLEPIGLSTAGALYYSQKVGRSARTVYVASIDFKAGKVLAPPVNIPMHFEGTNFMPTYSPDGKYLAYASTRGKLRDGNVLVIRSLETGEARDLSPESLEMFGRFTWAPDGRSILVKGRVNNEWGLRLVDVQTGNFTTVFEFPQGKPPNARPVFSKDGKEIYYALNHQSAIVAYNLETHEEKILYQSKTRIHVLDNISPDGRTLAFSESDTVDAIRPSIVKTISTSGGEPTDVYPRGTEGPGIRGFQWTNEGDLVVVERTDDEQDSLLIFPKEGGDHRRIELGFKAYKYELHPDGQRIVFHDGELEESLGQEIWALENFLPKSTAGE